MGRSCLVGPLRQLGNCCAACKVWAPCQPGAIHELQLVHSLLLRPPSSASSSFAKGGRLFSAAAEQARAESGNTGAGDHQPPM